MISVCTTVYKSENHIKEFMDRTCVVLEKIGQPWEIVIVDDGSPDKSKNIIIEAINQSNGIKLIELSRNFGHHKALRTALEYSKGDLVFMLDSDLEEEPELLNELIKKFNEEPDSDIIYSIQENRKGGFFERISGAAFWMLFKMLTGTKIVPSTSIMRLMSRKFVDSLLLLNERNFFIDGITDYTGYNSSAIYFEKKSKGQTSYTFSKKLSLAVDAITSFSTIPLKIIFLTGVVLFFTSCIGAIVTLVKYFTLGIPVLGWTSLIISIWLLSGLLLMMMGILGIYMARIFTEVKQRPISIVKKVYE